MNTNRVPKLLADPTLVILISGGEENPVNPRTASAAHYTLESIQARAETITDLLMGIPDFQPPPRWGLNE